MKVRKGDNVKVQSGKERGQTGKILQVFVKEKPRRRRRYQQSFQHAKTRKQGEKGPEDRIFSPIAISSLALVCPKCGKEPVSAISCSKTAERSGCARNVKSRLNNMLREQYKKKIVPEMMKRARLHNVMAVPRFVLSR